MFFSHHDIINIGYYYIFLWIHTHFWCINRFSIITSDNLSESHFISFISPYRDDRYGEPEELYEEIKKVKLQHPHIRILAVWKDEIIQQPPYDKLHRTFKMLVDNGQEDIISNDPLLSLMLSKWTKDGSNLKDILSEHEIVTDEMNKNKQDSPN